MRLASRAACAAAALRSAGAPLCASRDPRGLDPPARHGHAAERRAPRLRAQDQQVRRAPQRTRSRRAAGDGAWRPGCSEVWGWGRGRRPRGPWESAGGAPETRWGPEPPGGCSGAAERSGPKAELGPPGGPRSPASLPGATSPTPPRPRPRG